MPILDDTVLLGDSLSIPIFLSVQYHPNHRATYALTGVALRQQDLPASSSASNKVFDSIDLGRAASHPVRVDSEDVQRHIAHASNCVP